MEKKDIPGPQYVWWRKRRKNDHWFQYLTELRYMSNIVDVVRGEHINMKKQGKSDWVGLSPFTQEKSPSFRVSYDKQVFKCFSTGKGGGVFTFLMLIRGCTFGEAVAIVAEMYHFGYARWKNEKEKCPKKIDEPHCSIVTYMNACPDQKTYDEDDDLPF